jgi:uncharacterized protein (TIGR04141 family)
MIRIFKKSNAYKKSFFTSSSFYKLSFDRKKKTASSQIGMITKFLLLFSIIISYPPLLASEQETDSSKKSNKRKESPTTPKESLNKKSKHTLDLPSQKSISNYFKPSASASSTHASVSSPSTNLSISVTSSAPSAFTSEAMDIDVEESSLNPTEDMTQIHVKKRKEIRENVEKDLNNSQLSIYLLKKNDKLPPSSLISEETREEFKDFPWQFFNEDKHHLIGASHDQEVFIDGQLYTDIKDGDGEEIYVFQETGIRQTHWTKIIYPQAAKHKKSQKTRNTLFESNQYKEPKGAVIFIKKMIEDQERFFAITFGTTGRFLLNTDYCEPAFGKHYAYNLLSSNPKYKAQSYTEINLDEKKLKSEQSKANGKVEVLRGVRAFIPKALTVTNGERQICSFLGAHICVSNKFAFETIGETCRKYLEIAEKDTYKTKYAHVDYFTPLEHQETINKVFIESFKNCHFEAPFEIERPSGFQELYEFKLTSRSSWGKHFPSLKREYKDFSCLADDLKKLVSCQPSVEALKNLRLLKITATNDSNQPLARWRADQLITTTVNYMAKTYWIEGGEIFKVHKNFIGWVNERLDRLFWRRENFGNGPTNILPEDSSLRSLTPFNITDTKKKYGKDVLSENAYNERMAKENPTNLFLFDCATIKVKDDPHPKSRVEPCDLFTKEGDLVHLKRWSQGSSSISYLVTQGLSSANLFLIDKNYREEFSKMLSTNSNFDSARKKLEKNNFRVVLGFIHPNNNIIPSGLPFNAKMELLRGLSELEKIGLEGLIISIKDDNTTAQSLQGSFMEESLEVNSDSTVAMVSEDPLESVSSLQTPILKKSEEATIFNGEDTIPIPVKFESIELAKKQGTIGPRSIPGWKLHDVDDKGNCFYDAIVHQMQLIHHPFLASVHHTTLPRNRLRLHIQGKNFKDDEWADDQSIDACVKKLDLILAIVDTRTPENGFTYYYLGKDGEVVTHTPDNLSPLPIKPIIRLAATGNHYLSVVTHPDSV